MITLRVTVTASLIVLVIGSTKGMGGQGGTGSGPPAKEMLEQMLMSADAGAAGLFKTETGDLNLGVINRSLDADLLLNRSKTEINALAISDSDFESLSGSKNRSIDAVTIGTLDPVTRSYIVEDGAKLGELVLKDRRETARAAVK